MASYYSVPAYQVPFQKLGKIWKKVKTWFLLQEAWDLGRTKTSRPNNSRQMTSSEGKQYRIMEKPRALNMILCEMPTTAPIS